MVSGPSTELLEAIRHPSSLSQQIASLKQLKNDIVGHEQRKELVVKQGVVEPLVNIVSAASRAYGKRKESNGNGTGSSTRTAPAWTEEDEAMLQATLVLGTLASGGRAFVQPLIAADTVTCLLDALLGDDTPPPRLLTALFRALKSLATCARDSEHEGAVVRLGIVDYLHHRDYPGQRDDVLHSDYPIQQLKLTMDLIALSATNDTTRSVLLPHLDALAALFATYAKPSDLNDKVSTTMLPSILSAITAIVSGSNYRTQCFIHSIAIRELFTSPPDRKHASCMPYISAEGLLPTLHIPAHKSVSFHSHVTSQSFPALGSLQPTPDRRSLNPLEQSAADAEHSNAVVSYLLFLARSMKGLERLLALRLLALVNNAIEAASSIVAMRSESHHRLKERERHIAILAVPLAVSIVDLACEASQREGVGAPLSAAQSQEWKEVQEQACEVLALLIQSSKELQVAAVDAGAIKRVCPILKKSFDNVTISKPMWSASRNDAGQSQSADVPDSAKLGSRGLPPEIQHAMRCRQSALEAIAALARREDIHRKAIVDAGVVTCIVDSLKPLPADFGAVDPRRSGQQLSPKDCGNTLPVLLAACHAAQSISRSVSLLRTSLIDAGIAAPIAALLTHENLEVQIAATDVCCNLLLEFSPMREELLKQGVMSTLCKHAKEREMSLRLSSIWALKHAVLNVERSVKLTALEELGTTWLVDSIQGRQTQQQGLAVPSGGVSIAPPSGGLSTPNAAGEQVDLLNPPQSNMGMDIDDPREHDDDDEEEDEDEDGELLYDEASSTHYQASQLRSTLHSHPQQTPKRYLSSMLEIERDPRLAAQRSDVAVQEHTLDFVRNLLNGDDCAFMLEALLDRIGVQKFFGMLDHKLAPVSSTGRVLYQPTELILSTIHVFTHVAAAAPKHKQFLIAAIPTLLKNWLPHFSHHDRRVRVMSVWTVNSLTWVQDNGDKDGARSRVQELRRCGIEVKVRQMEHDVDYDVKERVKTAVRQMDAL